MAVALSPSQQVLWERYLETERRGTREEKLDALDTFIEALLQSPAPEWKQWALAFVALTVDADSTIPVRQPLFQRVLFPALIEALGAGRPGSARWLAGLADHLHQCPDCVARLGPERASAWALLKLAVVHDPTDGRARKRLINVMAEGFRYAIHEVPAGVLCGPDGATVAECDELLSDLDEFRALLAAEEAAHDYATLVTECERRFRSYKQYLVTHPRYTTYSAFLDAHISAAE